MGVVGKVKKLGKKAFKYSPLGLINYTGVRFAGKYVRKWLMPKIPDFGSQISNQAYSIDGRSNVPARNSPQNEHFGFGRRWPEYKSQPWSFYRNDDQVLCQLFFLTVGECEYEDLRVGQTPFSAYPNARVAAYGPGVPVTLFHTNVFTNDQVDNIEIKPGALESITFSNDNVGFHTDGTIDLLDGQFRNIQIGSTVNVSGTGTHDGDYTVVDADSGGDWIEVSPAFLSDTTESATFTFQRWNTGGDVFKLDNVSITATASPKRFSGAANLFLGFRLDDTIGFVGAGGNDTGLFKIVAMAGDASWIEVDATPTAGSFTTDLYLAKRWQGWYAVCPPRETVDKIQLDFLALQGLGRIDGDQTDEHTVLIDVQYRPIDDDGVATGAATQVQFSITAEKRDPVRRSVEITPSAGRYEVRVSRGSPKSDESEILDGMDWGGLKGFIVDSDPPGDSTFEGCTVLAVELTASGQLSAQNESTINLWLKRKLPTWNGTTFTAPVVTDSIAWADVYLLRKCGIPDSKIDLAGYLAADTDWASRGGTFTHDFDGETNAQEARRLILRCGRATPTRDPITGIYGFRRDEPRDPVQMFTDLNSDAGDFSCQMIDASMPTGMVLEYMDTLTWTPKEVAIGDVDTKPARDRLEGCTSRQHAWEILYFEWYAQRYRTQSISIDAEMEPILLGYDDAVLIQSAEQGWGQATRLVSAAGSTLTVHPPLDWGGTGHHVFLRDPNGASGAQISVTRGTGDDKVILGSAADVELISGDGEERTIIAFGSSLGAPVVALTRGVDWSLGDNGGLAGSLDTVLEDARVFDDPGDAPD